VLIKTEKCLWLLTEGSRLPFTRIGGVPQLQAKKWVKTKIGQTYVKAHSYRLLARANSVRAIWLRRTSAFAPISSVFARRSWKYNCSHLATARDCLFFVSIYRSFITCNYDRTQISRPQKKQTNTSNLPLSLCLKSGDSARSKIDFNEGRKLSLSLTIIDLYNTGNLLNGFKF